MAYKNGSKMRMLGVSIREDQREFLIKEASRQQSIGNNTVSMSVVVRQAIDELMKKQDQETKADK